MITIKCKSKVAEQLLMNELKYNKSLEIEIVESITSADLLAEAKEYEDLKKFKASYDKFQAEIDSAE